MGPWEPPDTLSNRNLQKIQCFGATINNTKLFTTGLILSVNPLPVWIAVRCSICPMPVYKRWAKYSGNQPQAASPESPAVNSIQKPRRLCNAKLPQLLKWEPETFGAIRVQSKAHQFCYSTKLRKVVYCWDSQDRFGAIRALTQTEPRQGNGSPIKSKSIN
jgi:hypothetical protein